VDLGREHNPLPLAVALQCLAGDFFAATTTVYIRRVQKIDPGVEVELTIRSDEDES